MFQSLICLFICIWWTAWIDSEFWKSCIQYIFWFFCWWLKWAHTLNPSESNHIVFKPIALLSINVICLTLPDFAKWFWIRHRILTLIPGINGTVLFGSVTPVSCYLLLYLWSLYDWNKIIEINLSKLIYRMHELKFIIWLLNHLADMKQLPIVAFCLELILPEQKGGEKININQK